MYESRTAAFKACDASLPGEERGFVLVVFSTRSLGFSSFDPGWGPFCRGGYQVNRLLLLIGAHLLHINLHMSVYIKLAVTLGFLESRIQMELWPSGERTQY